MNTNKIVCSQIVFEINILYYIIALCTVCLYSAFIITILKTIILYLFVLQKIYNIIILISLDELIIIFLLLFFFFNILSWKLHHSLNLFRG